MTETDRRKQLVYELFARAPKSLRTEDSQPWLDDALNLVRKLAVVDPTLDELDAMNYGPEQMCPRCGGGPVKRMMGGPLHPQCEVGVTVRVPYRIARAWRTLESHTRAMFGTLSGQSQNPELPERERSLFKMFVDAWGLSVGQTLDGLEAIRKADELQAVRDKLQERHSPEVLDVANPMSERRAVWLLRDKEAIFAILTDKRDANDLLNEYGDKGGNEIASFMADIEASPNGTRVTIDFKDQIADGGWWYDHKPAEKPPETPPATT